MTSLRTLTLAAFCTLAATGISHAADTTATQQLAQWSTQAGSPGNVDKGKVFFTTRHGGEWSCASCHGTPPTAQGKHASTGKSIAPLAQAGGMASAAAHNTQAAKRHRFTGLCAEAGWREKNMAALSCAKSERPMNGPFTRRSGRDFNNGRTG